MTRTNRDPVSATLTIELGTETISYNVTGRTLKAIEAQWPAILAQAARELEDDLTLLDLVEAEPSLYDAMREQDEVNRIRNGEK